MSYLFRCVPPKNVDIAIFKETWRARANGAGRLFRRHAVKKDDLMIPRAVTYDTQLRRHRPGKG